MNYECFKSQIALNILIFVQAATFQPYDCKYIDCVVLFRSGICFIY